MNLLQVKVARNIIAEFQPNPKDMETGAHFYILICSLRRVIPPARYNKNIFAELINLIAEKYP